MKLDRRLEHTFNIGMLILSTMFLWSLLWSYAPNGWVVFFGLAPCAGLGSKFCDLVGVNWLSDAEIAELEQERET